MKIDTMPKKKILAGATAMVALSGFVPAINAASPTDTANVGVSVVIQQAITINVGAPVNFGTIVLIASTVAGFMRLLSAVSTSDLTGEVSLAGGHARGTMAINSSAGSVNIALGVRPTYASGAMAVDRLVFDGSAITGDTHIFANNNQTINLVGGNFDIGGYLVFLSKPTPGTYNTKSYTVTVTDI